MALRQVMGTEDGSGIRLGSPKPDWGDWWVWQERSLESEGGSRKYRSCWS